MIKKVKSLAARVSLVGLFVTLMALVVFGCGGRSQSPPLSQVPQASPDTSDSLERSKSISEKPKEESSSKPAPEKVAYSISTKALDVLPLLLGKEKGLFLEEGIDLDIPVVKSDLAIAGLLSEQLDYSQIVGIVIQSAAKGMPLKTLAYINERPGFYLMGAKGISSVMDLKGKNVGVSRIASSGQTAAMRIIEHYGLDPKQDVNYVAMGDIANSLAGMQAGSIQAGILVTPDTSRAKQMGFKELGYLGDIIKLPQSGLTTSEAKIKNNPQQVKKVTRALVKSIRYTLENKQEAINYSIKEFGLEPAVAEDAYMTSLKSWSTDGWVDEEGTRNILRNAAELGGITKEEAEVPLEKVIDSSFLKEVLKELGIEHK